MHPRESVRQPASFNADASASEMTKREYFAACAMQGMLSGKLGSYSPAELADRSVALADSLMVSLRLMEFGQKTH